MAEEARQGGTGRDPQDLEPGAYDVVLEPYAVDDLLSFVASLGLQGRALLERTSFATGKLGQRLLSEAITLRDDPLDPAGTSTASTPRASPRAPSPW